MTSVVDTALALHYSWGKGSEGWHLLDRRDLSIIQELVPPGDRERRHYHSAARQFFYILKGEAVIEVDDSRFVLRSGQGLEVPPGVSHQFMNESEYDVWFLVVSAPRAHGDRADIWR